MFSWIVLLCNVWLLHSNTFTILFFFSFFHRCIVHSIHLGFWKIKFMYSISNCYCIISLHRDFCCTKSFIWNRRKSNGLISFPVFAFSTSVFMFMRVPKIKLLFFISMIMFLFTGILFSSVIIVLPFQHKNALLSFMTIQKQTKYISNNPRTKW